MSKEPFSPEPKDVLTVAIDLDMDKIGKIPVSDFLPSKDDIAQFYQDVVRAAGKTSEKIKNFSPENLKDATIGDVTIGALGGVAGSKVGAKIGSATGAIVGGAAGVANGLLPNQFGLHKPRIGIKEGARAGRVGGRVGGRFGGAIAGAVAAGALFDELMNHDEHNREEVQVGKLAQHNG